MQLTDPSLIVVLALLALVTFVVLVAGWPHWRSRAMQGATRAVQGVGLSVLAVAVCAVALNNQYLFYSSWGDLFASSSPSVTQHQGGGGLAWLQHGLRDQACATSRLQGPWHRYSSPANECRTTPM